MILRAEWTKLRTTPGPAWLLTATAIVTVALSMAVTTATSGYDVLRGPVVNATLEVSLWRRLALSACAGSAPARSSSMVVVICGIRVPVRRSRGGLS